jgi:hypothetical protein
MRRLAAIILIIAGAAVFNAAPSYCEAEAPGRMAKSAHGLVSSVDWVGGSFTIKWLDIEFDVYQEMSFKVPDGFKMKKGPNTMDLSELEIGDPLMVNYYENSDGSTELISVNDSASFGEEF